MKNLLSAKLFFLLMITFSSGCTEKGNTAPDHQFATRGNDTTRPVENAVAVAIDVEKSILKWRGTKLRGIRGHEGTLHFEGGELFLRDDTIVGGNFLVNMESLEVTDITEEQATAKNNLKSHLKSEFKTAVYPQSMFEITAVKYHGPGEIQLGGNLSMRGTTHMIYVPVKVDDLKEAGRKMTADITLDRTTWNIGEDGSWLEKRVVDNEFNLKISITF